MAITIRRVLLVLMLITLALPWVTRHEVVYGQDDPGNTSAAPAGSAPGFSVPTNGLVAIIEIEGPIFYKNQLASVKRRADRAINDGADLIVFDLDTPGGDLLLAVDLSSYIRTLGVPTVAWVDDQALSAGILIASACDELIMSKASLTGDCGPIIPGRSMASSERAKALSLLLAEFRANAQDNYAGPTTDDYALFNAMCVLGIDVYAIRHRLTGEARLVSQADYAVMVDGVSPIDAAKTGPSQAGSVLFDTALGEDLGRPVVTVAQAEMGQWEFVRKIHDGSSFVTLTDAEALDIGLSRKTVSSENEIKQLYGAGNVLRYNETWSESLVGFLVHPVVRACLLLLGIAGLLMEYFSPGLFVPGIVGVAAIVVLIGAPFLVGLAQTWHLVLIVIGAGLVIYELITMSTFGVLAVVGLLMFLTGLVLSGVQSAANGLPADGTARQVVVTSMSFVGALFCAIPVLFLLMRYFGSLPILNKMVLTESQLASTGPGTHLPHQRVDGDEAVGRGTIKPGTTGVVTSTGLRPTGRIEIKDQLVDATSTGGFIEPGTTVRVLEIHGNLITVEAVKEAKTD